MFAAFFGVVMGLSQPGWAEGAPPPVALTWDAPAGCPSGAEVAGEVERTLAKSGTPPSPLTVAAHVEGGGGQTWQGRLVLEEHGTRTARHFEAESCRALASAAAVIIAVALDEAVDDRAAPAAPETAVRSVTPAAVPARPPHFVGVNGVIDDGTMPSPVGGGLEVTAGHEWGRGRFRPALTVATTWLHNFQPAVNSDIGTVHGTFWSLAMSGRACLSFVTSNVQIGPCAGGEVVAMHSSNDGYADISLLTATHAWFSFLGSLAASFRVDRSVDFILRADCALPTARPTFNIYITTLPAYILPAVAFRGAVGFAYRFQ
jgi:hypothetical protein